MSFKTKTLLKTSVTLHQCQIKILLAAKIYLKKKNITQIDLLKDIELKL